MASEQLRKKWGTIFMGDREATMEQLDAMQEPVLRERQQKDLQAEYVERVRKRAADRAREILGEAYAERQKLLAEAEAEIAASRAQMLKEIEAIRAEAESFHKQAALELSKAKAEREEADRIKNQAHDEGFQVGMDQAGAELKEFRADMGNELAQLLRAVEGELTKITAFWRDDLAELVRVAVQAGTGFFLQQEHERILTGLVLEAVNLLEEREVVSLKVNPEDESIVSDMFRAAREKAPELKQWIVNGDESIERGGLVAESGSGSVDLRRQNFQELVNSIMEHLALPEREVEKEAQAALHVEVEARAQAFSDREEEPKAAPEAVQEQEMPQPAQAKPEAKVEVPKAQAPKQTAPQSQPPTQATPTETLAAQPDKPQAPPPAQARAEAPAKADQPDLTALEDDLLPPTQAEAPAGLEVSAEDLPSLAELEEELFPVSHDEEHQVLEHGGFLSDK
ncbi:MAG: flagellar assembly protein FliH [Desulfovibrio sp.]|nr:flagellar assembly protein FliH [Desulfovibrio sp.]